MNVNVANILSIVRRFLKCLTARRCLGAPQNHSDGHKWPPDRSLDIPPHSDRQVDMLIKHASCANLEILIKIRLAG